MDELTAFMCADGNFEPKEKLKPRARDPTKIVLSLNWALAATRQTSQAASRTVQQRVRRLSQTMFGPIRPGPVRKNRAPKAAVVPSK